ncbi:MAG: FkbM family methyltransferase [Candidatus Saganbacteria bacterium]|nr:FkbM family methyltransferase [Candidatus Saganbacteria bacterium]
MSEIDSTQKHHDLIYDVGMHKGEDTDYYLKKGFKVVGFEADPDLIVDCKKRFSKEIENGQLTIVEGAIVDPQSAEALGQTIKFYKNLNLTIWGSINADWALRNEKMGTRHKVIEVKTVDFTECLKKHGIPYYMKIDIEGCDTICLKALLNFKLKPTYVSIESNKVKFGKLLEEFRLFAKLGYAKFKAIQQQAVHLQSEPKPAKEGLYANYTFQKGSSGLFGEDLPGNWKNRIQIIMEYMEIFMFYKLFGDSGILTRFETGKKLRIFLCIVLKRYIPGWYDTHAKHSS